MTTILMRLSLSKRFGWLYSDGGSRLNRLSHETSDSSLVRGSMQPPTMI